MNIFKRARLFVRDYFSEFGVAWSLARMRDCERNGGHRWGDWYGDSAHDWWRDCKRCGTSEAWPHGLNCYSAANGTSGAGTMTVTFGPPT